jgi:type IV pilus assembly protein PilA
MGRQKGFSLIELLIVVAIILIVAAIAIPSLLRSKMAANNSAAASTLRAVNTAEATYSTAYPAIGYSAQWNQLGPAAPGTPCSLAAACLLDAMVACGGSGPCTKLGYNYFINDGAGGPGVGPTPPPGTPPETNFVVSATPLTMGITGDTNYCSFLDTIVRSSKNATPPVMIPAPLAAPGETIAGCSDGTKYGPI